jgi:hypothetical protein
MRLLGHNEILARLRVVHLELVVARARLEEEVVRQVLDRVAGREHVVAVRGPPLGVLRQRALAAGDEVVGIADALDGRERGVRRAPVVRLQMSTGRIMEASGRSCSGAPSLPPRAGRETRESGSAGRSPIRCVP